MPGSRARSAAGERWTACAVLATAALIAASTLTMPPAPPYAKVGPELFPYITAGVLAALGLGLLLEANAGGWRDTADDVPADWRALAWVGGGLAFNVAAIAWTGFVVASGVMFVCIARGFGSRAVLRDAAIGVVVCLGAYVTFRWFLGVNIGAGPIEELVDLAIRGLTR